MIMLQSDINFNEMEILCFPWSVLLSLVIKFLTGQPTSSLVKAVIVMSAEELAWLLTAGSF